MDPVSIGLMALTAGGQLMNVFGKQKRKSIDPNWLKANFGAGAVNDELQQLFNRAINSTQGQQLMTNAAQGGQQFQTDVARQGAAAGLGAGGGATGGADMFASAGAGQAVNNLQRGMKSSLMESLMPVAQNMVQSRLQAYMAGENQPQLQDTRTSQFGDLLTKYGQMGTAVHKAGGANSTATTANGNTSGSNLGPGGPSPIAPNSPTPGPASSFSMAAPTAIGQPSMASLRPSRFMSKMSRFSGVGGNVQPMGNVA